MSDTDTFARIDKLSFQFGSDGSQFSAASTEQLYQLSRDAGLLASFPMWRDHVGSVLCIDFSKQVSLGLTEYPGLLGATTFSYDVDVTLLSQDPNPDRSYTLYTVIVEPSIVTIKNQSMDIQNGTVQMNPTLLQTQYKRNDERVFNPYGGVSYDDFRRFGRKVGLAAQKGLDFAEKAAPYVKKAIQIGGPLVAELGKNIIPYLIGAGVPEDKAYAMIQKHGEEEAIKRMMEMVSGAGKVGGRSTVGGSRPKGGRMLGGKQTSRAEMDKYLLQY